jgi:hypothetical protein
MFIKLPENQKQHIGMGDYRVLWYQAVASHICLVDSVYACLIYLGIESRYAQDQDKNIKVLHLESVLKLKDRMRQIV